MLDRFVIVLLLSGLAADRAFAQSEGTLAPQPTSPDTVIRVNVNLVQIDAVVTDHRGKPVTDLKADEFRVLQDGKQQQIRNFAYVSTSAEHLAPSSMYVSPPSSRPGMPVPRPVAPVEPAKVRRTIALVVDDLGLSFEGMARVRMSLKRFVDREMQDGDLVAILRTGAGMGALQQFTSDKRLLASAIDHLHFNVIGRVGISTFQPIEQVPDPGLPYHGFATYALGTMGALAYVVDGLRDLPGRKSIVLFSEDIKAASLGLMERANRASVVINCIDTRGPQPVHVRAEDSTAHMTFAEIDAVAGQRASQVVDSQQGLVALAHGTGGLFLVSGIDEALRQILQDSEGYYLIGYQPDASTFDRKNWKVDYHTIKVEVSRPGLTVRTRRGFLGQTDSDARSHFPQSREGALQRAIHSPFAGSDIHVRLTPFFTTLPQSVSIVSGILYIDPEDLTFTDQHNGTHKAVIDVLAMAFGGDGQPVAASDHTYTGAMEEGDYRKTLKSGLFYNFQFRIKKPGAYQVRVAVRDSASGKLGSANQFIEVPDISKGHLTLSAVVIESSPAQIPTRQATAVIPGAGDAEGRIQESDAQGNPGVRSFEPGAAVAYGYQVLNAQMGRDKQVELAAVTHLYREGGEIYAGKPSRLDGTGQPDMKRLLVGGNLKLAPDLAPGQYILQIVVTDKLANEKYNTASQWIDFEVR